MSRELYVHRELTAAPGAPLFFVFHGTGGDENNLLPLARDLLPNAHIVSPRGDVSEGGALRFFRRTDEGVFDMEDFARATAQMSAFVASIKSEGMPSAVVGMGYSNGANVLAATMFAEPGLFDAAVLLHPLIPFEPPRQVFAGRRVLLTAGRRDPICLPARSQALGDYFAANGADTRLVWHDGGHELARAELEAVAKFLDPYRPEAG